MDERARKISETMRSRKIDNFKLWRERMRAEGKIKSVYDPLPKNGDTAELIGVVLGDGHIQKFPRTERLLIFSNANNPGFVERYSVLVEQLFEKQPYVYKQSAAECVRISLYEKHISSRLGIPAGARKDLEYELPHRITTDTQHIVRFLRGLYEAEGSLSHHEPTYTHKFSFSNRNKSLINLVAHLVTRLGFRVNVSGYVVQVSRKAEVQNLADLLQFRHYG